MRQFQINHNHSSRHQTPIRYIVIHDTANPAPTATAYNHYRYFNSRVVNASAHYFVDDREILEICSPDRAAWHCGDGRGKHGITNQNSIGVELCINQGSDREKAKKHLTRITHYLMVRFDIPKERVVRHFDASGKHCPGTMMANQWEEWNQWKQEL